MSYQLASCITDELINYTVYSDQNCQYPSSTTLYNLTYKTGTGAYYDFNCDADASNSYVMLDMALSCGGSSGVMYAALSVCSAVIASTSTYMNAYCEPDYAELQYFNNSCNAEQLIEIANATDDCGYLTEIYGTAIYAQVK